MKSNWPRKLMFVGFMITLYFLPDNSLDSVKRALEVILVAHLGIEVFRKMQQG